MANEGSVSVGLTIRTGNLYERYQHTFRPDVAGAKGPVPGAVTVSTSGTDIDLSGLTNPGLTWVKNTSSSFTVSIGLYDPDADTYRAFLKWLPDEAFPLRLAGELLGSETTGTGTGTGNATVRMQAYGGSAVVQFFSFEE